MHSSDLVSKFTFAEFKAFIASQPLRTVRDPLRAFAAHKGHHTLKSDWISVTTPNGTFIADYVDQPAVSYVARVITTDKPHNYKQLLKLI